MLNINKIDHHHAFSLGGGSYMGAEDGIAWGLTSHAPHRLERLAKLGSRNQHNEAHVRWADRREACFQGEKC